MVLCLLRAGLKAESLLSAAPPYRLVRGLVLDTIFGPVESFDYVSTTAPSSPPPRI